MAYLGLSWATMQTLTCWSYNQKPRFPEFTDDKCKRQIIMSSEVQGKDIGLYPGHQHDIKIIGSYCYASITQVSTMSYPFCFNPIIKFTERFNECKRQIIMSSEVQGKDMGLYLGHQHNIKIIGSYCYALIIEGSITSYQLECSL